MRRSRRGASGQFLGARKTAAGAVRSLAAVQGKHPLAEQPERPCAAHHSRRRGCLSPLAAASPLTQTKHAAAGYAGYFSTTARIKDKRTPLEAALANVGRYALHSHPAADRPLLL